jgi:EAL domain-containing protein (putative c-di-GMP-specific phosphodiesterase class I)
MTCQFFNFPLPHSERCITVIKYENLNKNMLQHRQIETNRLAIGVPEQNIQGESILPAGANYYKRHGYRVALDQKMDHTN